MMRMGLTGRGGGIRMMGVGRGGGVKRKRGVGEG